PVLHVASHSLRGPRGRRRLECRDDARQHRLHADAGERAVGALKRPVHLPPGAVALGGGRSVEPDTLDAKGGREVKRPRIAPDNDRGPPAASLGSGNSIAAGRTPSGSSSARYCSITWRAVAGGVTRRFVKSALNSRQSPAAKPIRSGARVAAVKRPLFRSPCRSRAT